MSYVSIACIILMTFTGVVLADDKPLSDSSIAGLASVGGFIVLLILTSTFCYCVRKKRHDTDRKRLEKLSEVKKIIEEHYSESRSPISSDTDMVSSQKYKEWRQTQPNATIGASYVRNERNWAFNDPGYAIRTTNHQRSISPTRSAPRSPGYERGRSHQRNFVYANQPGFNTLLVKKRSKSAPVYERQVQRQEYVRNAPPQMFYTKSHFLAIKQPFSKKFLLPPTRTFYAERPMVRRMEPPVRQVVEVPPPPPRQEVKKSNVYHVQYHASPNQTVHRTNNFHSSDDFHHTTNTVRAYTEPQHTTNTVRTYTEPYHTSNTVRTYTEPQNTTYTYGNNYQNYRSYEEPAGRTHVIQAEAPTYSTVHHTGDNRRNYRSDNTIYVNSQGISYEADDVVVDRTESYRHSFSKEARVYNGIEKNKTVEDDFTIVDFVEDGTTQQAQTSGYANFADPGPSAHGGSVGVTVLSTSTPRAPNGDSSAIDDLDTVLGTHSANTSSSSSSSSSSDSSKKDD